MLLTILLAIAKVTTTDMVYSMNAMGFEDLSEELIRPTWGLFGLTILMVLISFIAIFLYTKRVIQRRITTFNLLLKIGFYVLVWIYMKDFTNTVNGINENWMQNVTIFMAAPILAMIFDYLAARAIAIDEMTIRSINRLRE